MGVGGITLPFTMNDKLNIVASKILSKRGESLKIKPWWVNLPPTIEHVLIDCCEKYSKIGHE